VTATAEATIAAGTFSEHERPRLASAATSESAKTALAPASNATLMIGPAASTNRLQRNEAAAIISGMPCG
jgi:hypothetical protein